MSTRRLPPPGSSSRKAHGGRSASTHIVDGHGDASRCRRRAQKSQRVTRTWSSSTSTSSRRLRPRHQRQSTILSTSRTWSISSSIWPLVMISGGDSAMMSPVVRIRAPRSNALTKAEKARLVGLAGDRLELDRADQADIADVDDMRLALQRMQRILPIAAPARRRASAGPPPCRCRACRGPPRRRSDCRNRCSRGRTRSCAPARS